LAHRVISSALTAFVSSLAVLLAVVVVVVGVMLLVPPPPAAIEAGVEEQWERIIGQYNLDPVYPPQEDFAVGDLFVEIVNDKDPDPNIPAERRITETSPFNKRAPKLAHVNVKQDLKEAYSAIPYFGSIIVVPVGVGAAPLGLFEQQLGALPIAAFPDLATHSATQAVASIPLRWLHAFGFGASSAADSKVTLHALTYGLPNADADAALSKFCTDEQTKAVCTEKEIRRYARSLIGPHAEAEYLGQDLHSHYSVEIRCFMVVRVFLATDIATQTRVERALSGRVTVSAQSQPAQGDAGGPTGATGPGVAGESQAQLSELAKRVALLEQSTGGGNYVSDNSRSLGIQSTFARPVAVGYIPMLFEPKPSEH
jgi:hypothetical protein